MRSSLFFTVLLAFTNELAAVDFTPQYIDINADGLMVRQLCFKDGPKRIWITPPKGWTLEGEPAVATLRNESTARATVTFTLSPRPLLPGDDPEKQKATREAITAMVPKGAENVAVEGETVNPWAINAWSSYEVKLGYDILGVRFARSVLLIKLNSRDEMQVIVTAPANDYANAAQAATACLQSWHKR